MLQNYKDLSIAGETHEYNENNAVRDIDNPLLEFYSITINSIILKEFILLLWTTVDSWSCLFCQVASS